jgi:prophage regulatory protein
MRRLIRHPALKEKGITWSVTHLGRLEAAEKFPRRIHLGTRTICWDEAAIDEWIAQRVAESDARAGAEPAAAPTEPETIPATEM